MALTFTERRKILEGKNSFELTPVRNYQFNSDEKSKVTIIIPKFKNKFIIKYLVPLMKSPEIKLDLDDYGSFFWMQIDGSTTIAEITKRMKEKFGDGFTDAENRISRFTTQLYKQRLITFQEIIGV